MKLHLIKLRDDLLDSFWFLPLMMAIFSGGAALGSIAIDHAIGGGWVKNIGWVWSGGADGARSVLSVVAGSVMTVVSIVFSLTITTLAQTSSQYGSRVLRNFTSDRGVQFTLGIFIATFIYCLLVLRTVRSVEETEFVPYLSVNIGVLLSLASLAVLIFFIHHVSQNIQAENLVAEVGLDFQAALPSLFPECIGKPKAKGEETAPEKSFWKKAHDVDSVKNGYVQRVDKTRLMQIAVKHDLVLKLEKRPGDFIAGNSPLLRAVPPQNVNSKIGRDLRACFSLGRHRTPHQDVLYSMQQLIEIAAHALSPGINEPFTALTCIDWLGASLGGVAMRDLPSPLRHDSTGVLRVVAPTVGFEEVARMGFDQIRIYGASNPEVMLRLIQIIGDVAPDVRREADRDVLIYHAHLIGTDAAQIVNEDDRQRVELRLRDTLHALAQVDLTHIEPQKT